VQHLPKLPGKHQAIDHEKAPGCCQFSFKSMTENKSNGVKSDVLRPQRFEHSSRFHKKISSFISFPEHLDMTPFMSRKRNNNNNNSDMAAGSETDISLFGDNRLKFE